MRCSEKATDENKAMHGKACKQELKCVNCGKGHGAWSKECPKRVGLVNKVRERKSILSEPSGAKVGVTNNETQVRLSPLGQIRV